VGIKENNKMSNRISISKDLNNKATTVFMNNATYYFSYTTLVMVHYQGEWLINENYYKYSSTTSKHFHFWLGNDVLYSLLNEKDFEELINSIGD